MPSSIRFLKRPQPQIALASVLAALSMSVSHHALAACTTADATSAGDTIVCNDVDNPGSGAGLNAKGGDDTITVNGNPTFGLSGSNVPPPMGASGNRRYSLSGGNGNDTITINGGTFLGTVGGNAGNDTLTIYGGLFQTNVAGDGRFSADNVNNVAAEGNTLASSVTGNDVITFYGGTVNGEVQGGNGDDTIYLYGGNINRVEGNNSDTYGGDKIYLDGANLGSWESPSGGAGGQTLYIRNGSFGVGAGGDDDDDNGSSPNLDEHMVIDPVNSVSANPQITMGTGFNFGNGADSLTFIGAVMTGDNPNLVFSGDDVEFNGGGGDADSLVVRGGSDVILGEVENFETLSVRGESKLTLTDDKYTFAATTTVNGGSELYLSGEQVEFNTSTFTLGQADDDDDAVRIAGLPTYYDAFKTGGILRIGATPDQPSGGDDDDDDDNAISALDDDDEGGETPAGSPVQVFFNVGEHTFINGGTIVMLNGVVGDQMSINDIYQSNGGNLAIDSTLGASGSPTDNLTLQGAVTGTPTTVYVNNVGGTGAFTGHGATDGIEIVTATPNQLANGSFALATNNVTGRQEVIAGAFSYQLFISPDQDAARLQSDILPQVAGYTMSPAIGLHYSNGTFDTLYKRLGEIRLGQSTNGGYGDGGAWVKGNYSDVDIDPKAGFGFSQTNQGILFGFDKRISSGQSQYFVGLFGGVGSADADVDTTFFGAPTKSRVNVDARTFGGYLTYTETRQPGVGFYADVVAKFDDLSLDTAAPSSTGSVDAFTVGGSGEVGYGIQLGGNLILQPQAQLTYSNYDQDAFVDSIGVSTQAVSAQSLIGRAGLQLQGNFGSPNGNMFSPYAIVNVMSDFRGDSTTVIGGTPFASDIGLTWYNVGGGFTADVNNSVKLYGSADYDFGDVEGWSVTGGGKVLW